MRSFGSDPEFLVVACDEPQSAIEIVGADSQHRIKKSGHEFYYDNVLAECAIKPGYSKSEVLENFRECICLYQQLVEPFSLKAQASAYFADAQLKHPDARKVGCAEERCAYLMQPVESPTYAITNGNLRSCGGHIHLGSELLASDGPEPILTIYMMDLFLGIPSLWLDRDPTSHQRRALYGQAGRFRAKKYGVEYRSLGNFWLQSPEMVSLIYDLSMFVQDFVESQRAWGLWEFDEDICCLTEDLSLAWYCRGYDQKLLQKAINQSDKILAEPFLKLAKEYLPDSLRSDLERAIDRPQDVELLQAWNVSR